MDYMKHNFTDIFRQMTLQGDTDSDTDKSRLKCVGMYQNVRARRFDEVCDDVSIKSAVENIKRYSGGGYKGQCSQGVFVLILFFNFAAFRTAVYVNYPLYCVKLTEKKRCRTDMQPMR